MFLSNFYSLLPNLFSLWFFAACSAVNLLFKPVAAEQSPDLYYSAEICNNYEGRMEGLWSLWVWGNVPFK
jgi:hypothetical protein